MMGGQTMVTIALAVLLMISMLGAMLLAERSHLPDTVAAAGALLAAFAPVVFALFKPTTRSSGSAQTAPEPPAASAARAQASDTPARGAGEWGATSDTGKPLP